jgi:hypothetical protein
MCDFARLDDASHGRRRFLELRPVLRQIRVVGAFWK